MLLFCSSVAWSADVEASVDPPPPSSLPVSSAAPVLGPAGSSVVGSTGSLSKQEVLNGDEYRRYSTSSSIAEGGLNALLATDVHSYFVNLS